MFYLFIIFVLFDFAFSVSLSKPNADPKLEVPEKLKEIINENPKGNECPANQCSNGKKIRPTIVCTITVLFLGFF